MSDAPIEPKDVKVVQIEDLRVARDRESVNEVE